VLFPHLPAGANEAILTSQTIILFVARAKT